MAKVLSKEEWKKRKKLYAYLKLVAAAMLALLIVLILLIGLIKVVRNLFSKGDLTSSASPTMKQELDITELFLTPNGYTRPQNTLKEVKGIVIHYVAKSGSSAVENRNYYEGLKSNSTSKTAESCHFIIDLDGGIVQCIPLNEVACASGTRNEDTIAITFCHPQIDGEPTAQTYESLLKLTTYLCAEYGLTKDAVIRHSDLGDQSCPKYFAEQEGKWAAFLAELDTALGKVAKEKK
ncbi:MAG: N-acetylmuramoyl-L-alanine amidase [Lachnospiraceae bacterium]|nr:N-acetylmuramoyl-L-alanine amidase [Lachnospiraceae bacterium]